MGEKERVCIEDEISLVDIFLVMARRKAILIGVLLLVTAASITYALTQKTSESFAYITAVEVGSVIVGENMTEVDSIGNLMAKIEQAYIPEMESELDKKVNISVSSPSGSNLIVFSSVGGKGQLQQYSELHKSLFDLLQKDLSIRIEDLDAEYAIKTRVIGNTREERVQTKSKSRSSVFVVTLGVILGLMLGVFAAFFAEFVANVRRELRERKMAVGS